MNPSTTGPALCLVLATLPPCFVRLSGRWLFRDPGRSAGRDGHSPRCMCLIAWANADHPGQ